MYSQTAHLLLTVCKFCSSLSLNLGALLKKLFIFAGLLLSVLFLFLALKDTDLAEIRNAFREAKYWPMVPMLLSIFGFYWLKAVRWSVLLSPSFEVSGRQLAPAMMAGAAGNNLLPAHFGELVRVYFAGEKFSIPKSTVLATLVVERLFDIIVVLLLFSLALLAAGYSSIYYGGAVMLLFAAFSILIASVLLARFTDQFVSIIDSKFTFVSVDIRQKISQQIKYLGSGLAALSKKNLYLSVITNTVVQWLCHAACFYFSLLAFDLEVSPLIGVVILGFTVVGLTLPTSPGFFGTIEYCYVLALTAIGIDASTAVSAAIFYHLPAWLGVTFIGLVLLRVFHFSFRDAELAERRTSEISE